MHSTESVVTSYHTPRISSASDIQFKCKAIHITCDNAKTLSIDQSGHMQVATPSLYTRSVNDISLQCKNTLVQAHATSWVSSSDTTIQGYPDRCLVSRGNNPSLHVDAEELHVTDNQTTSAAINLQHGDFKASSLSHSFSGLDDSTMTIKSDSVTVKNLDIHGVLNVIGDTTQAVKEESHIISLGGGDRSGLLMDTVSTDVEYMSQFKDVDGSSLFTASISEEVDVQTAWKSKVLDKGILFQGGAWDVVGGCLNLTRVIPQGHGISRQVDIGMRVTDSGDLEVKRLTTDLLWNDSIGKYVSGATVSEVLQPIITRSPHVRADVSFMDLLQCTVLDHEIIGSMQVIVFRVKYCMGGAGRKSQRVYKASRDTSHAMSQLACLQWAATKISSDLKTFVQEAIMKESCLSF